MAIEFQGMTIPPHRSRKQVQEEELPPFMDLSREIDGRIFPRDSVLAAWPVRRQRQGLYQEMDGRIIAPLAKRLNAGYPRSPAIPGTSGQQAER